MHLVIYVHDLVLEVGHSRATIEVLRKIPRDKVDQITLVCFRAASIEEMNLNTKQIKYHQVPFGNIKPFFFKSVFFQIYTFFHYLLFLPKNTARLSVGIAALHANIINIQFIHHIWHKLYFKLVKPKGIALIYKKILFLYYDICEGWLYSRKNVKKICLSQFIADFVEDKFSGPEENVRLAYSGINLEQFSRPIAKIEAMNRLRNLHPEVVNLDLEKPIYLFIGAFERKGLPEVLDSLPKHSQLLVVGDKEAASTFSFPTDLEIIYVKHTKSISDFYSLADCFVFPTHYEPFGLVLIEAAAMGLPIITTKNLCGASEILQDLPEVELVDSPGDLKIKPINLLSLNHRLELRKKREKILEKYNWDQTSKAFVQSLG